jgi:hypothetical protein
MFARVGPSAEFPHNSSNLRNNNRSEFFIISLWSAHEDGQGWRDQRPRDHQRNAATIQLWTRIPKAECRQTHTIRDKLKAGKARSKRERLWKEKSETIVDVDAIKNG